MQKKSLYPSVCKSLFSLSSHSIVNQYKGIKSNNFKNLLFQINHLIMNIIVLGAGLVGAPLAIDLAKENKFHVTVADIKGEALNKLKTHRKIHTVRADLSQSETIRSVVRDHDMVVGAVPGFMGYRCVEAVIEERKDMVDISFFPEDPFRLDGLARERGVTVLCDMGVAPGMSHVLIGHVNAKLDSLESVRIYVGGLPKVRKWPWGYKAVFSPADVIEEYTRPARLIEDGHLVVKPALSDPEIITFPVVGELEAFNSDGLRSLLRTVKAPWMTEKTLRYKGHLEKIAVLRDSGFFNTEEIEINGRRVSPRDVTAGILFPQWTMKDSDEDMTVMKIIIEGRKGDKRLRYTYDLLDEYDRGTHIHSMARTTGYTATMAVRMLARGLYRRKGISPPEYVGEDDRCVAFMIKGLQERGIIYKEEVTELI
jgi:lysine 6-dehydrogenase